MFDDLEAAILAEKEKIHQQYSWITRFKAEIENLHPIEFPWVEQELVQRIEENPISHITKIAAVDGGVVSESLVGFDLVLYRGAGVVFTGIGKQVKAKYIPEVDPKPSFFFNYTLESRFDFNRLTTLLRLSAEYQTAIQVIEEARPTILYVDGKLSPLTSDFSNSEEVIPVIRDMQITVKNLHKELIRTAIDNQVLLCGIVKDSRSRDICKILTQQIPKWVRSKILEGGRIRGWKDVLLQITDTVLTNNLLKLGERLSWIQNDLPNWEKEFTTEKIWHTTLKAVSGDFPVRIELLYSPVYENFNHGAEITLQAFMMLCKHGLPLAIPTIIQDADSRAKISTIELDSVVDQISILLGIPKEHLKKRRSYTLSMD